MCNVQIKQYIISNFLNTLNSIKNNFKLGDIAIKVWNKLENIVQNKQIMLMWVPGHTNIKKDS